MSFFYQLEPSTRRNKKLHFVDKNNQINVIDTRWLKENDDDYLANIIDWRLVQNDNGGINAYYNEEKACIPFSNISFNIPWAGNVLEKRFKEDTISLKNRDGYIVYPIKPLYAYFKFEYASDSPTAGTTYYVFKLMTIRVEGKLKGDLEVYINDSLFYTLSAETFSHSSTDSNNPLNTFVLTNATSTKLKCKYKENSVSVFFKETDLRVGMSPILYTLNAGV